MMRIRNFHEKQAAKPCKLLTLGIIVLFLTGCASYQPFDPETVRSHPVDSKPDVPEIIRANMGSQVEFIANAEGIKIPVRVFGENNKAIPVLMIHGLQSHSGWFVQSAYYIASLGLPVYQIDRRGSGLSSEPRGHAASYDDMVNDILTVAKHAMEQHGVDKIHLLGHCFGAIPSTAFACRYPEILQSLILCTPAIYTQTGVYFGETMQILESELTHKHKYIPIHINPDQFTDSEKYLRFIRGDKLTLKQVTTALYFQVPLARHYINKNIKQITMPVFMGMAGKDTICNNSKNGTFFNEIPSQRKMIVTYERAKHILEFSHDRDIFFNDLAAWFSTL
ncbi:MAG: alpha/beta fold hydrolase [Planctomycetota bacterium]